MPIRRASFLSIVVLLLLSCGGGREDRIRSVENGLLPPLLREDDPAPGWTIGERMRRYNVPGAAVVVIDEGRIDWMKGYGVRESGGRDSVDARTLFPVSSLTMPVTASAALRLADEGRLDLDRDVNGFLRRWRVPEVAHLSGAPVTVRRILSHDAGLTLRGFEGFRPDERLPSLVEILEGSGRARNAPVAVDRPPGSGFRWSAGGYAVLRLVLEEITGEPFDAWMERTLFDPLDMNRTMFNYPGGPPDDLPMAAHHLIDGFVTRGTVRIYPELAAQGLWTTAEDLALWMIALGEAWTGRSDHLLSRERAREMLTPAAGDWGLGLSVGGGEGPVRFSHGDGGFGCGGRLASLPEEGRGAVVLTNGESGGRLAAEILRSVAEAYQWPSFRVHRIRESGLDPSVLPRLAGEYEVEDMPGLTRARILVEEGIPAIRMLGVSAPLAAASPARYFSVDAEIECRFDLPAGGGPATGFDLFWRGAPARATRTGRTAGP